MKNRIIALVLILSVLALAACAELGGAQAEEEADIPPVVIDDFAVIAEGMLVPLDSVQLSFNGAGGRIVEVMVDEGDVVEAGDVLARLEDSESLAAQIQSAETELLNARQALDDLNDPLPYTVAAAQAERDIATAEEELDDALISLNNLYSPDIDYYRDEVDRAQDALANAEANAEISTIDADIGALNAAQENLEDFEEWLEIVEKEINGCVPSDDRVCDPDREVSVQPGLAFTLEEARDNYNDALNRVRQLELTVGQTDRNVNNSIDDAQEALEDAQERLDWALAEPDSIDVMVREADVTFWQAQLEDARDRLADAQRGPDPDDIEAAESRIASAEASLLAARASLEDLELVAPIGGTVSSSSLKVGETVSPGVPVITLADFGGWLVETDNLTEIEVVEVSEGQTVTVVLDALPDTELAGEVTDISTVFEEKRGDITYTVEITLLDEDPRMRWGMTAVVTFEE